MKNNYLFSLCVALLLGGTNSARAQAVWKTTIKKTGNSYQFLNNAGFDPARSKIGNTDKQVLEVTCDGLNCDKLTAQLKGSAPAGGGSPVVVQLAPASGATGATARFELSGATIDPMPARQATLLFFDNGTPTDAKASIEINVAPPETGGADCDVAADDPATDAEKVAFAKALYDDANNTATFIVSHTGNVLYRPGDVIDEDDKIVIVVRGPRTELDKLLVQRKSAFRDVGVYRVVGEGTNTDAFIRKAAKVSDCGLARVELADFAPGRGQVQLSRLGTNGVSTPLSDFDFGVHPLYQGALSFGPVCSWLTDRSFGTVAKGADNVITVTEQAPQLHYVFSYTHYIWGRRDVEKRRTGVPLYQRLYPTFGLSVENTLKNAYVGATYDVFGSLFYLTAGCHVGRVTVVDPSSGLGIGSVLPTGVSTVPTRTETQSDWYVGVSLDLRAAAKLFAALGSGAASGAASR
ncbi:hypothetical protein JAO73_01155 [Hymenobacter sp. BT523]|uniref:hypothetical protein n=1 Tax=Hymenobacter sp. BT523 TaxID=2795725 RepID=UPI0018EAC51F|nr:hypothetical protein [Hymenobacter sp. BT523]MBJ6107602.1 hypothetical protein [Hymenobacter sp. BT523]